MRHLFFNPAHELLKSSKVLEQFMTDIPCDFSVSEGTFNPKFDVIKSESNTVIEAELPGVKKEDVKIVLENNVITISGEKKINSEKKDATFVRQERYYGAFSRSFKVPSNTNYEQIEATFIDGILTVNIAKPQPEKPIEKVINIQ